MTDVNVSTVASDLAQGCGLAQRLCACATGLKPEAIASSSACIDEVLALTADASAAAGSSVGMHIAAQLAACEPPLVVLSTSE